MDYRIGVDSGGTFTDCIVVGDDGSVTAGKSTSTPWDPSLGVINAVEVTAVNMGLALESLLSQTVSFSHGSTVALNAFLERRGVVTGLITTVGFEDTLLIGRVHQKVAGLSEQEIIKAVELQKPKPIIPRTLTRGILERIDYEGKVLASPKREDVEASVRDLIAVGVRSIAVCFLWSFMNPIHEQLVKSVIHEVDPDCYVTLSSELVPTLGEYERMATTALNAYVGPVISSYLMKLQEDLTTKGLLPEAMVMQSVGGLASLSEISRKPVNTFLSGPVGGVVASKHYGEAQKLKNILCTDVGGTSFDVALLIGGEPEHGYPVIGQYHTRIPMVDIQSVGTGGGSIARVDAETGTLQVGPESSGAYPGPVCYGRGGIQPTVTDAGLVLGYLNTESFLGGAMKLDLPAAENAIRTQIAEPLGISMIEAALGILTISNAQMADLLRKSTIKRGYDPREFTVFAYGGAGPQYAWWYAAESGINRVVIPALASVFSAFGLATADWISQKTVSEARLSPTSADEIEHIFTNLEEDVMRELENQGMVRSEIVLRRSVAMRYRRQVHEVAVEVPAGKLNVDKIEEIYRSFELIYESLYGKGSAYKAAGVEIFSYSVSGRVLQEVKLKSGQLGTADARDAIIGHRDVVFPFLDKVPLKSKVYRFEALKPGMNIEGPAVVEGELTTAIVPPKATATVDVHHNLILSLEGWVG